MTALHRITVREHARLTTTPLPQGDSLDEAHIPPSAFDWLCGLAAHWRRSGAQLLQVEGRQWLRLDNHVGVLESPCGVQLEILPKHVDTREAGTVQQARTLLRRLLASALDLPPRQGQAADLMRFEHPLTEWVMRQFLLGLEHVLQRGLRSDYRRIDDEQPFLRGRLDVLRQMRQPPGRDHRFQICHDLFDADRAENRLLKAALLRVVTSAREPDNWRLANELAHRLAEVPASRDQAADWRRWQSGRLMAHYQPVKPWCALVLGQDMPLAVAGETRGISLLFPMERLFERHVARVLRRQLPAGLRLVEQAARHTLCEHDGRRVFTLRPDLLLTDSSGHTVAVLDTKWKRLDGSNRARLYDLAQQDFYQLHAYGQVCLGGTGPLGLIYPRTDAFQRPLPPFRFSDRQQLLVLPFDLQDDTLPADGLLALVPGMRLDQHPPSPSTEGQSGLIGMRAGRH